MKVFLGIAVMATAIGGQALAASSSPPIERRVPPPAHHPVKTRRFHIAVTAYDFPVAAPHDVATGQATGKRQHQPTH